MGMDLKNRTLGVGEREVKKLTKKYKNDTKEKEKNWARDMECENYVDSKEYRGDCMKNESISSWNIGAAVN